MSHSRALAAVAVTFALLLPASASATTQSQLVQSLSRSVPGLGPDSALLVTELESGRELFSMRPDTLLIPASNQKLYTTSAALLRYGPQTTLPTSVQVRSGVTLDPVTGTLPGDLYLVGGGDPTLGDAGLTRLATALRKLGIKQIQGAVRADESFLDTRRGSFDSRWKIDKDLGGQLSALSYIHGRSGSAKKAGKRLDKLIEAQGIAVGANPKPGKLPGTGQVLATINSPSIERLAKMINVPSENFYAELLLKDLGAAFGGAGTTAAGLTVTRSELSKEVGIAPKMVDGSGLSRQNKTTARQLVKLLTKVRESELIAKPFADSLPKIGHDGTVRKRLRRSAAADRCIAKTGTLIGVSSLSGYCTTPAGRTIVFSMIANRVNAGVVKDTEDTLLKAIARYDG